MKQKENKGFWEGAVPGKKKIASDVFEHWENIGRNLTHTAFEKKLNIYIESRGERKAVIW